MTPDVKHAPARQDGPQQRRRLEHVDGRAGHAEGTQQPGQRVGGFDRSGGAVELQVELAVGELTGGTVRPVHGQGVLPAPGGLCTSTAGAARDPSQGGGPCGGTGPRWTVPAAWSGSAAPRVRSGRRVRRAAPAAPVGCSPGRCSGAYGLATQVESLGDDAVTGDEECAITTFVRNTADWLMEFPSREQRHLLASVTPRRAVGRSGCAGRAGRVRARRRWPTARRPRWR